MKRALFFLLAAAMLFNLAACKSNPSSAARTSEAAPAATKPAVKGIYTPGTYTATTDGIGRVTATVTVDANSITDVKLDLPGETEKIGQAAGTTLRQQILDKQGAEIDGVSGATTTTTAVKAAIAKCLAQATGAAASGKKPVKDGSYSATASGFSWAGQVTCDVTFADNAIKSIAVKEEHESYTGEWFQTVLDKFIPRVVKNQSLSVNAVSGATFSSNAVKNCVAQAINAAGGDSSQWYTPIAKKTEVKKLEGYDVVVVGLGGSGILSYCSAAYKGAAVFGLEAAGKLGGDSACTYGPMAINSKYLKDLYNGGKDYIDADDVYKTWMEYVGSDKKADVIHEAVYDSGTALDFFVDNFGFTFTGMQNRGGMLGSFVRTAWKKLWTVYTADKDNTSWNVLGPNKTFQFDRAMEIAKGKNPKNGYMTELRGDKLLTDSKGKVIGVSATSYDGTTYEIYGKSVILATGGFLGNDKMMTQYLGSPVNSLGVTVNNGAGIRMGQQAGGALYNIGVLPMIHITQVPNIIKNNDLNPDQKAILSALCLVGDQPSVTTEGKAWGNANKSGTSDSAITVEICYAPGYKYYVLYTKDEIDAIASKGLRDSYAAATSMFMNQGGKFSVNKPVADIYDILAVGEKYGDVIKAGSIGALAKAIGCDAATLSKSVGGKDTAYYAVIAAGYSYATVGGLDIDANMNVLRPDGKPIANLYAVGQDSQGVCNASGKAYTPWAGQAQSWTFVSGLIAGDKASSYAKAN
jgi:Succinate dehydrogenase/fumarate reductase, flavoprotein subunit